MPAKANSNSDPVQQHFVPKVYLKSFCNDRGLLQMYDKKTHKICPNVSPAGVASHEHLYTLETPDGKDYSIEKGLLGQLETDYGIAIRALECEGLVTAERATFDTILRFLSFLHARNPEQLDVFRTLSRDMIEFSGNQVLSHNLHDQGELNLLPYFELSSNPVHVQALTMQAMMSRAEMVHKMLMGAGPWVFYVAPPASAFVTSDNPYRIESLGWIPLSSTVLIASCSNNAPDEETPIIRQASPEMVANINSWQVDGATRFVFAAKAHNLESIC